MFHMDYLVVLGVLFLVWLLVIYGGTRWKPPRSRMADRKALRAYERRDSLMVNTSEQALFQALLKTKPAQCLVMAKVRLEDILQVKDTIKDGRLRWQYRSRIKSRHVDYALCDQNGRVFCVIELDGSSHRTSEAQMVDSFKDAICKNAGLALVRIKTGSPYEPLARKIWSQYRAVASP